MKILEYQGGASRISSELLTEQLRFFFAKTKIMQGKSKLLNIKSKYKQKWFKEFIKATYEKNKEKYDHQITQYEDGGTLIRGSTIGGIEALLSSYGSSISNIDFSKNSKKTLTLNCGSGLGDIGFFKDSEEER